jgi:hypothetical protein
MPFTISPVLHNTFDPGDRALASVQMSLCGTLIFISIDFCHGFAATYQVMREG